MKKVLGIIGCKSTKGMFGIEIEAEGQHLRAVDNDVWKTVPDGSLRGEFPDQAAEFVLQRPLDKRYILNALDALIEEQKNARFAFSLRTSVHVHMNVQQLTEVQLGNVIYTYLLLEELLVEYCGQTRKANRFCLRLQDAEGLSPVLQMLYTQGLAQAKRGMNDNVRYASINLAAIPKYGSLEFRAMRGNLDRDVLNTWISALDNIREFAVNQPSPAAIYELYGNTSYEEFISLVLGGVADKFKIGDWQTAMARCFSLSIDIPYMYQLGERARQRAQEAIRLPEMPIWQQVADAARRFDEDDLNIN